MIWVGRRESGEQAWWLGWDSMAGTRQARQAGMEDRQATFRTLPVSSSSHSRLHHLLPSLPLLPTYHFFQAGCGFKVLPPSTIYSPQADFPCSVPFTTVAAACTPMRLPVYLGNRRTLQKGRLCANFLLATGQAKRLLCNSKYSLPPSIQTSLCASVGQDFFCTHKTLPHVARCMQRYAYRADFDAWLTTSKASFLYLSAFTGFE